MASVYDRGTRRKPNWWAKVQQRDGSWKAVATKQPTKATALKWALEEEGRIARGEPDEPPPPAPIVSDLAGKWLESLTNRTSADDESRWRRHVAPFFAEHRVDDVTLPAVMRWIDALRGGAAPSGKRRGRRLAADRLSDATVRHCLNLLSRFFSWCVERGHAELNPVRQIPTGRRPLQSPKKDRAWIDDDKVVRDIMNALPSPYREAFYLGNRSGLRPSEQRGLRISDLGFLDEGNVRVRYSDDGPLKEDKRKTGKCKWVPAPDDAAAVLGPLLAKREAEGAQPEDYVFMPKLSRGALKQRAADAWHDAAIAAGLFIEVGDPDPETGEREKQPSIGYYEATRHSMASRNMAAGASLDEVSAALGHASTVTTRRHYDHFIRKEFSSTLRAGIGAAPPTDGAATITPIKSAS